jgi:uncharacterized membrane protein
LRAAPQGAIRSVRAAGAAFARTVMDTISKLGAAVAIAMMHSYPVLESIAILPLLLKKYYWVLVGCLLVMLLTLGVERNNNYSIGNLLSSQTLIFLVFQTIYTVIITGLIFWLKTLVLRSMRLSPSGPSKAD